MKNRKLDLGIETPLYLQLKEALMKDLVSSHPDNGRKLPTFKEITGMYGVGLVTAVKAVDKLKAEGLVYGRRGMGLYLKDEEKFRETYQPRPQTRTLGITFWDIYNSSSPYISEIVRTVTKECETRSLNLQLFATHSNNHNLSALALLEKNIVEKHLDGLILASRMPAEDIIFLKKKGIPFVWVDNDLPDEDICCIRLDKFYSLSLLLAHLSNLKYRRVALLSAEEDHLLEKAFQVLCTAYGLEGSWCLKAGPEEKTGYLLTGETLSQGKPDVIITRGAQMTAAALDRLSELKISLPDDLALVGIVNAVSGSFAPRNITVLQQPLAGMVKQAVQMLDLLMNGKVLAEKKPVFTERLLIRGSCGFPLKKEISVSRIEELKELSYPRKGVILNTVNGK